MEPLAVGFRESSRSSATDLSYNFDFSQHPRPPGLGPGMAYDAADGQVVLFGG
jgi:hypothetical protein